MHPIAEQVKEKFPGAVLGTGEFRGDLSLSIRREDLLEVCRYLHDDPGLSYDYIVHVSSVDWQEEPSQIKDGRFEVVYEFYSLTHCRRIRVKTRVQEEDCVLDSLCSLWKGAEFMEREVYDMMGIRFHNHPDLRRILLPEDYDEGYPLRKDFPMVGKGWRDTFEFLEKMESQN